MNNKHIQIQYFSHNSFILSKRNLYETCTLDILKTVYKIFLSRIQKPIKLPLTLQKDRNTWQSLDWTNKQTLCICKLSPLTYFFQKFTKAGIFSYASFKCFFLFSPITGKNDIMFHNFLFLKQMQTPQNSSSSILVLKCLVIIA